jgi:glycosyltransferase involved in cell wall biosynthesis
METPLVSVVIPAYNASRTIARAVDSALAQSYKVLEVIVVDDGSDDNLGAALQQYGDAVLLVKQDNAGPGAARNRGASEARGEFLAFLDSDDFWHPQKLDMQLAAFHERPNTCLCWSDYRRLRANEIAAADTTGSIQRPGFLYSDDFSAFFRNPYVGTPGVMIRRDLFARLGGFRTDLRAGEDVDLWLRAAYRGVVAHIPVPLFFVVPSNESLTSRSEDGTYRDNLIVIDDFCRQNPDFARGSPWSVRQARSTVLANWGGDAYTKRNFVFARNLLCRSFFLWPNVRAGLLLLKTGVGILRGRSAATSS